MKTFSKSFLNSSLFKSGVEKESASNTSPRLLCASSLFLYAPICMRELIPPSVGPLVGPPVDPTVIIKRSNGEKEATRRRKKQDRGGQRCVLEPLFLFPFLFNLIFSFFDFPCCSLLLGALSSSPLLLPRPSSFFLIPPSSSSLFSPRPALEII